ncbi:putative mannosyltransferase-II [Leishmania major strain Friedlin]|uniref:GPI mannosyltransferase 2 n=1 Tax=Leishmania major TaxID=5664 RepID=Q4QDU6_LEIMA|nr:putative mannosyltransferase-II [Leishmania major strain Friedlin]CAG9572481.1 mannosyltransferase-II_-_putative [Leishmania major strain Friedlin]CAJ03875.1 putative mannosyltransferase-II [Leishmania major strain Friedlin]|eukprot:XP_001682502.1 putative mannosyltransferase-II [Leishmania major strain Friedlin]
MRHRESLFVLTDFALYPTGMAVLRCSAVTAASRPLAFVLAPYTEPSFNLLDYLGTCTDTALVLCVAVARLLLLCLMWFSRAVAPIALGAPGGAFVFDTGEELYDDARFSMVRNWDGVHMFFIAQCGYLYESQIVFFPGLPALIRGLEHVTRRLIPVLHRVAPVAFYVCLVNIAASCLAGVVLRRLTILTFLGPEAVRCTCRWRPSKLSPSTPELEKPRKYAKAQLDVAAETTMQSTTEATVCYRLMCRMIGTVLEAPDIHAPLPAAVAEAKADALRRRRVVGGAALVWIITPAMVFAVAVYTESLFSLATMLGVYFLAWHEPLPQAVQLRIASYLASVTSPGSAARATEKASVPARLVPPAPLVQQWALATNDVGDGAAARSRIPGIASLLPSFTHGAPRAITVKWEQRFLSSTEVAAVLLFTLAGTFRSNAFTYAGFLIFPICVQVALPAVYRAQASAVLAGVSARAVMSAAAKRGGARDGRATVVVRCPTLRPPLQRMPHPLRMCIVALECICVALPYIVMNYMGYRRFVLQLWDAAAKKTMGQAFWRLYPMLQKKYWGVSLFSAYTFANFPNVVLALPVAVLTAWCLHAHYLAPAWANLRATTAAAAGARRMRWQHLWIAAMPLLSSSNVAHLVGLSTLALTLMHVQVTNRFVTTSPALYWLLGMQLASRPTSRATKLTLLWCILWGMAGGILFPNHLPWT